MPWRVSFSLVAATLVIAAAGYLWHEPEVEVLPEAQTMRSSALVSDALTAQPAAAGYPESTLLKPVLPQPASLQGSSHGVRLLSLGGELVLTSGLRDLFDYYLSTLGELSLHDIRLLVEQALAQQLASAPLAQALQIYDNYLRYREALQSFDDEYAADREASKAQQLLQLQQRQQALILLQDQMLGAEVAQVLFAQDRQLDDYTLEKARLLQADISAEQRAQALANLQASLPAEVVEHQQRNLRQSALMAIGEAQLTPAERYQRRAEVAGEAVAQRLAQLDAEQLHWQQRLDEAALALAGMQQAGLSGNDYQQAFDQLLQQQFSAAERLRARVLLNRRYSH
jgi:lipase chaperone LimK